MKRNIKMQDNMMKATIYNLMAASVMVCGLWACSETDAEEGIGTGEAVSFAIDGSTTRTARLDQFDNRYQIVWSDAEDDKVRVFCNEAYDVKQYDYTVVKAKDAEGNNTSNWRLQYAADALKWGGEYDTQHNFYAVYPTTAVDGVTQDGIITFNINRNQTCTLDNTLTQKSGDLNAYIATPDMTNSYMVATAQATRSQKVSLAFDPIMTTLDVTVKCSSNQNEKAILVSGISVIDDYVPAEVTNSDQFKYDAKNKTIATASAPTASKISTYTTFVGIENGEDDFVTLNPGESVRLTVFLPPYAIGSTHPVTVKVHATGTASYTVELGKEGSKAANVSVAASKLAKLNISTKPGNTQDWITNLDNNIYVQQLSIPGANEAMSLTLKGEDYYMTQNESLADQLQQGIRAFTMGVRRTNGSTYNFGQGSNRSDETLADALTIIKTFLDEHDEEFVVLIMDRSGTSNSSSSWRSDFKKNFEDKLSGYMIEWNPSLTVGQCRKHVVCFFRAINRSNQSYDKQTANVASLPYYDALSFDDGAAESVIKYGSDQNLTSPCYVYYKDKYSDDGGSTQIANIKALWQKTKDASNAASNYFTQKYWSFGYIGSSKASSATTNGHRDNAYYTHGPLYKHIYNDLKGDNAGSLGIVFMDWVGQETYDSKTVYGERLPQAIIDQNYRYKMQRAPETSN